MRLGVSYNVFDGEELLKDSILSIRDSVDYISIVYQTISNFGQPCNEGLVGLINSLVDEGLVNEISLYNPVVNGNPHGNEITKRQIGLNLSIKNQCTHHMSMDCDEFYVKEEFDKLKELMDVNGYGAAVAQMVTYYKDSNYRFDPKEAYYVPIITKIVPGLRYGCGNLGVLTDPTRTTNSSNVYRVDRNFLEMHHMSYLRADIGRKLNNSSAKVNFRGVQKIIDHYNNWVFPNVALMNGDSGGFNSVVETEMIFKLENYRKYVK